MLTHTENIVRTTLGLIGNITSGLLFLSPIPTVFRIWKKKSVEEFKYHPYVAGLMNCIFWVFYGLPIVHPHSILVVTVNGTGVALQLCYIFIYFLYTNRRKRLEIIGFVAAEVIALAAIASAVLLTCHTHEKRSMIVGIFCDVFGIILYSSPGTAMLRVIKKKSVEYMPLPLSLTAWANGVVWSAYALIGGVDYYILAGNGIGALFATSQLIVYAIYYKSTPKISEKETEEVTKPVQVQLSTNPKEEQVKSTCV